VLGGLDLLRDVRLGKDVKVKIMFWLLAVAALPWMLP
jgi:hypothetical protein